MARGVGRVRRSADDGSVETPAGEGHAWTGGSKLVTRMVTVGLWIALVAGPVGLALAATPSTAPTGQDARTAGLSSTDLSARLRASEFAERAVVTWLTASRDTREQAEALLGFDLGPSLPASPPTVEWSAVAGITAAGRDVWSVVVGAEVGPANVANASSSPEAQPQRRYFQVPIVVNDQHGVAVQGLPALVPGPSIGPARATGYRFQVAGTSAVGATVTEFLAALLTGSSALGRVLAPGVSMDPVSPAPYDSVTITELAATSEPPQTPADGTEVRVLVTATATSTAGPAAMQYPLSLRARAGRWEITAIDLAPAAAETDTTLSDPTTTPGAPNAPGTPSEAPETEGEK